MQLSEFTLRIILLFIPGITCLTIIDRLTVHKELKLHQLLINSFVLGFFCYASYYLIILIIGTYSNISLQFSFLEALIDRNTALDFKKIILVIGWSVPMGFIFTFLIDRKILHKVAHALRLSNKFGDVDVWSYIMNSKMPEWVVIRDLENDLMYEGWIEAFSDSTGKDEVFIRDVMIYKNSTAEELYAIPGLYLSRKRENLIMEFPSLQFTKYMKKIKEIHEEDKKEEGKQNG